MRFPVFVLAVASLFSACLPATADSLSDGAQDDAYIRCLIKRRVEPPAPKEDREFCLREAGVPDPGNDERQSRGKAWRDCLVAHAVELDDGVSPAGDIGQAVIALCSLQWRG